MTGQPTIKKRPRDLFAQRAAKLLWTIGLLLALLLAAGNLWLRGEAVGLVEGQAAARSLALASQFAEIAGIGLAKGQMAAENDLTARFIAQPEARYLLILDAAKTPLFSQNAIHLLAGSAAANREMARLLRRDAQRPHIVRAGQAAA